MPFLTKTDARLLEPRAPPTSTISGLCQSNPHYRSSTPLSAICGHRFIRDLIVAPCSQRPSPPAPYEDTLRTHHMPDMATQPRV